MILRILTIVVVILIIVMLTLMIANTIIPHLTTSCNMDIGRGEIGIGTVD